MSGIAFPNDEFQSLLAEVGLRLDPPALGMICNLCARPLHTLTAESRWPEMATDALRRAERDLWLGEWLQTVIERPELGATLVNACQHALGAWNDAERRAVLYAPRDRKSALMLFNDAPFVDRVEQRQHVQGLIQHQGRRVMVVRGDKATGKTHTGLFVRHLLEQYQEVQMAPIRLHEMGGEQIDAADLMTEIAAALGFSTDGARWDALAQEQRQAEKLSRWLVLQTPALRKRQETWLLVIDGLNDPRLSDGARELVDRLMIAGSRGDLVNTCLLLLALPTPAPAQVAGDVLETTLPPLTQTDFRTHVVELARLMGRLLEEAGAAALTDFLLKDLRFPMGHEEMSMVGQRLRQLPGLIARV